MKWPGIILSLMLGCWGPVAAVTYHVNPEGTGDVPTILAAIDTASAGDVIELACGTYHESTSLQTMLVLRSDLTIRSAQRDPGCVTIDAQQPLEWGSVFYLEGVSHVLVQGLTITGGNAVDVFMSSGGGGAYIRNCQDIRFVDCVLTGNRARWGGGLLSLDSEVHLERCVITENEALVVGGGLALEGYLAATDCLILENSAGQSTGDDGYLEGPDTSCLLTCCEKDLSQWSVGQATLVVDDEQCGPVRIQSLDLGSLKCLFR